ncbi:autotransporter domain-containing protein [uncultured Sphingomonas sp.]|uniref:autotransporter outer membrane beta-barrel domain-containing protein n=1 Tax=uncultured Sphingomonas sp. TaxID=158754 RepID=UPI0035C9880A
MISSADDAFRINFNPTGGGVRVDNFGTIQTTGSGQALDFDAAASGAASIVINNYASGVLRTVGQDAVRPGRGAVVTNAGLIFSDGAANNNYDGIDWQARLGTVINQASGTISGLRHGITSDAAVDITNAGAITGRNGSGVGSDGTGTVVNTGTITGQWDGVADNGDGDGVDIDFIGSVTNSGVIQGLSANGVDSGGRANSAEGVAMGGGVITNTAGALIFGAGNAVLINRDTNPGGVADGATTITNAGTIRATTGRAIRFVGDFADTITNSGTITGGVVGAIDMGGGNDTLDLQTGSVISSEIDGGAGIDLINLGGNQIGSFAGAVNFEALAVNSGSWTLTAASTFVDGIPVAAPATLIGTSTSLTGSIANSGTLIFDQAADGRFAGSLTGTGQLTKIGVGALTAGDQAGFSGRTTIGAGGLVLAGALPSGVTVATGGTLAGAGTVASITANSGGVVAPGLGIGTITTTGNYSQAAGSTYAAGLTAAGSSDRVVIGGTATIAGGALLAVTRDAGEYVVGTRYTLLTAAGRVGDTYTLVQTAAGGTELRLAQTGNAVFVDVARSAGTLAGLGLSDNQVQVAGSLAALGAGNGAYAALTLNPDDGAVRSGLDQLSGEAHASLRTTMVRDAQGAQDAARSRLLSPQNDIGVSLWAQAAGRSGTDDGGRSASSVERRSWGGVGGIDLAMGENGRIGVAGGYTRTTFSIDARASSGSAKSKHALVYAGGSVGPLSIRSSLGYAWVDNAVRRDVLFTGYAARLSSGYNSDVAHGQVEVGLPHAMLGGIVEPFAGVEYYRSETDGFAETGGDAALAGRTRRETFVLSTAGFRARTPIVDGLSARSRLGWQHVFDDAYPRSSLRFISGTRPFLVNGAPLSRDAAAVAVDLAWTLANRLTVTSGYSGVIGDKSDDSVFRVMASLAF